MRDVQCESCGNSLWDDGSDTEFECAICEQVALYVCYDCYKARRYTNPLKASLFGSVCAGCSAFSAVFATELPHVVSCTGARGPPYRVGWFTAGGFRFTEKRLYDKNTLLFMCRKYGVAPPLELARTRFADWQHGVATGTIDEQLAAEWIADRGVSDRTRHELMNTLYNAVELGNVELFTQAVRIGLQAKGGVRRHIVDQARVAVRDLVQPGSDERQKFIAALNALHADACVRLCHCLPTSPSFWESTGYRRRYD